VAGAVLCALGTVSELTTEEIAQLWALNDAATIDGPLSDRDNGADARSRDEELVRR